MLKCASVYTFELDDHDLALNEIKEQLDKKITLLDNTVGVVMCHPEFIVTGAVKSICEGLPFDIAGVTTSSQAVNDAVGELMLTIFVMTADDVQFRTGVTDDLTEGLEGPVKAAYEKAAAGTSGSPKLALVFPPFGGMHAGDAYVRSWEKLVPNTPVFGLYAIDDTATFSESQTLYNGVDYEVAMPFVLCYGNIEPRFIIATFTEENAVSSKAEVTKADGNCVYEINHDTAIRYFEDKGLAENFTFTPFMIDFLGREDYDGVPVVRAFAMFTGEGAAVFYGNIDEGSTITLLKYDTDGILSATRQKVAEVNEMQDINGAFLCSCVARRAALIGANKPLLELQSAKDTIDADIPFMMGYAGGEICPTSVRNGVPTNRFHNYSLVILVV